jgi:predicted Zn finger-like uncharacterized protein
MRLICPNCDAQYNVADDAIPEGGRDVQCSSCNHTWLQTEKPVVAGRETSKILKTRAPGMKASKDDATDKAPKDTPAPAERKPLDSSVADILRQEAGREKSLPRGGNAAPPATQAERPAEVVDAGETRKRIAQMTEEEGGSRAGTAAASIGAVTAGANLRAVPDIHEINAALRARAEASDMSGLTEAEKHEAVQRSGFRRGFFIVLILFAILITPYFFADQITENLPQTRGFMTSYVEMVDNLRIWLNTQVSAITAMIQGFTNG